MSNINISIILFYNSEQYYNIIFRRPRTPMKTYKKSLLMTEQTPKIENL